MIIFLADGFEETEALTPVDYLRRAGIEVIMAGVGTKTPTGAHGIQVIADCIIDDMTDIPEDGVILPGGMPGTANLADSSAVIRNARQCAEKGRLIAAICAAPALVLGPAGLLAGRRYTCYPGFGGQTENAVYTDERVVCDGNLITSRGPATAGDFAVEIIRYIKGGDIAQETARKVLL